eukprot:3108639-Alexandrium_andersonii.AAC.1
MTAAVTAKNRYFHRGGHTPMQLVYGVSLRLPFELLSDEAHDLVGREVLDIDGNHPQGMEAQFARAQA